MGDPSDLPDLINKPAPEKPVVILGRIGHGKTTFLRYLRQEAAKSQLERYLQLDVDFIVRPGRVDEIREYIFAQLEEQLRDRYQIDITDDQFVRAALDGDLRRFRRTS